MKKSLKFWNLLPWLLITLGSLLFGFRLYLNSRKKDQEEDHVPTVEEPDEPEPNKEQRVINHFKIIRDTLPSQYNDDVVKMITAQAIHETGNFTSRLYKDQNNLFGMRHPQVRETLSTASNNNYATFASLSDSVKDLMLYFKEFNIPAKHEKVADYVKILKSKGYFEDGYVDYFNAVRSHYNKVKALVQ